MPVLNGSSAREFRSKFMLSNLEKLRWFPGHMAGGIKKMQQKLTKVDCIVEVHDARIPFSGRNPNFKYEFLGIKPHILVLNKMDLIEPRFQEPIINYLNSTEKIDKVIYTNCKHEKSSGIKSVVPVIKNVITQSNRFNRTENREYGVMVIGVPNVGKSSFINSLRSTVLKKAGVAPVGARAGVTKAVQTRIRISHEPEVFIYDTPGILTPAVPNVEVGMKLALCAAFQDHLVGLITIADYLLYWLNKNQNFCYLDYFGIDKPNDNIHLLLVGDAVKKNMFSVKKISNNLEKKPNIDLAARNFINAFRLGTMGPIMLDADILP